MKAVILAGGLGTRLAEETDIKPKPMVEIGGRPILWHIMQGYAAFGVTDFVICLGYKGYLIKEYFLNYRLHVSDVTVDLNKGMIHYHNSRADDWRVTLVDTGDQTMTGGRLKRVCEYLTDDTFFFTYGDGLADIDLKALLAFHHSHGGLATLTTVVPPGRFGAVEAVDGQVRAFREKPAGDGAKINGGFFVLSPKVIDYIEDDSTSWEREPMERLASEGRLFAYSHNGFWHAMDTLRDKRLLQGLWDSGTAPWKIW